ncbi:DUF4347 domain-containing protein, partial [Accumulibacter sp.]|uniref:DUF4347 domain-containing protein n=1 Tax=Accumulibacter sp. TaxID=2053492 RepID=UPI0026290CE9
MNARQPFAKRPIVEELEPRLLYSADLSPLHTLATDGGNEVRWLETTAPPNATPTERAQTQTEKRHEVVIIDGGIANWSALLADLPTADDDRKLEIAVLDPNDDGLQQISEILAQFDDLAAVHLVSHGASGEVILGNRHLDRQALQENGELLQRWGQSLSADGDLLLYGCQVGEGSAGQAFITEWARLSGADVAASDDATGAAAAGGDWTLEASVGRIEAQALTAADWQGTLALSAQGAETRVNTSTTSTQETAEYNGGSVAMDANGNFVVVFHDYNDDYIYFQRFNAAGVAQGAQTRVNPAVYQYRDQPCVAMDPSGNFVVVWASANQDAASSLGIYAQRFSASGVAQGGEFRVNTLTAGDQYSPAVATDGSGNFVITWTDAGTATVKAQRYNASGVAQGGELVVDGYAPNAYGTSVAMNASGAFVVGWSDYSSGNSFEIYCQRFDASGAAQGGKTRVNTSTTGYQEGAAVGMADDGSFVVAFEDSDSTSGDIYFQRYNASGVAQGGNVRANTYTTSNQFYAAVAMNASGSFIVTWQSFGQDAGSSQGIYMQAYNADGSASGSETRVNTTTAGGQYWPSVAYEGGNAVVVWSGMGPGDATDGGIFFQRLAEPANTAPTFNGAAFGGGDGIATTALGSAADDAYSLAVQSDGKVVVAGTSFNGTNYDYAVVRYNADGTLDTTFSGDGKLTTVVASGDDVAQAVTLQADGKILVAGYSNNDFALVRYNTDGTLDTTFSGDGKLTTAIGASGDYATGVAVQADGKIVVAGYYLSGNYKFAVVRYNADGTLDTSFSGDGIATLSFGTSNEYGYSLALQADGKILVAGEANMSGNVDVALARLNTDGTLDASFSGDGMVTTAIGTGIDSGRGVTVQSDGKIVVAGSSSNGSNNDIAVVRYNTDGTLDTSFSGDGKLTTAVGSGADEGRGVVVQSDGKIVVTGYSVNSNNDFALVRYNSDGTLDTSFSGDGKLTTAVGAGTDWAYKAAVLSDGRILVAGESNNGSNMDFALVSYNSDGSLSTAPITTLNATPSFTEGGSAVVLDADVQVTDAELSAGNFSGATLTLARTGGANAQDVFGASGTLGTLTQGGNLVVGGTTIGTVTTNSAGLLVLTFNTNATNALVNSAMQQIAFSNSSDAPPASAQINWTFSDGNTGAQGVGGALSATGSTTVTITAVNDPPVNTVPGAQTTGEDTNLVFSTANGNALSIADPDGGAGTFEVTLSVTNGTLTLGGTAGLSFVSGDGSADTTMTVRGTLSDLNAALQGLTYAPTANYSGGATLTLQTSDLALSDTDPVAITVAAGNDAPTFTSDGNGTVTTAIGAGTDAAEEVVVQADGKYVVVGRSSNGANDDFAIARYNSNGTLDTTFSGDGKTTVAIGSGLDQAFAVALQSDGKIVVAGNSYNGTDTDFAVLRLNTDGSLDTTFSGDGKVTTDLALGNDDANSVLIQSDGKIVVTGSADNGVSYDFAAVRYNTNGTLDTSFSIDGKVTTFFGVNHDESWDSLLQSDGKIVLVGSTNLGASDDFAILRYNTDGTLDTTFSGDGKQTASFGGNLDVAYSVVQQADGKLVLAGKYFDGSSYAFAISRLTTTGSLDTTFSGDGLQLVDVSASADAAYSVALQSDGAIVLAGPSGNGSTDDFAVVRLTSAGALDTTFSGDGMLTTSLGGLDQAASVVVQSDGAIVVAGVGAGDFALVRYGSTGTLDATFNGTNTLDGAPSHTEGGSPVVLDGNVQVFDAELSGAGNYSGATLTLARHGGANAQDVFSATGVLSSIAAASGNVVVSGTTIGTYTNSAGTLVFTFNASATQTRVNSAMQAIAYSNASDAPPASVQIDWTFNDGNSGAQGSGGALSATGSTTVSITAVNDPPANAVPGAQSTNEDTVKVFSSANGNAISITDPDDSGATFEVTLSVTNGTLTLAGTSGLAFTVGDGGADTTMSFSGTVANINTALDGLTFSPTTNFTGGATLTLATADSVLASLNIDANLHARYTFENSASDVAPGTTQNGVLGGDANYAADGTRGRVLGLDGAGDYVSIADTSSFRALTQGTIASWVKFTDTGFRVIFSVTDGASNQNYLNLFVNNGKLGAQTVDGNSWIFETVSTATINDGNWHHVAFTVNGSGNQLYIDGTAAARTFNQGNAATSSFYASLNSVTSVTIGATYTVPGSYLSGFSGQIDDLRVYSRALTAGELSLLAADQSLTDSDTVAITVSAANDAPTFAIGTGIVTTNVTPAADHGNAVIAQSDGKLLVAGEGNGDFVLVRYKTDGTLDTAFGGGDGMVSTAVGSGGGFASSLALQADGKIIVSGYASNGSNDDFALVRYNPDGSRDTDFGTGGKVTTAIGAGDDRALGVAVQSNGRIVLAGYSYNGSNNDFAVVRYNSDGTLDTTFSGDGKLTTAISTSNDDAYAVLVQSDGKIVVVGSSLIGGTNWDFAAARYNSDGTLDTSFSGDGLANFAVGTGHDYACGVALQPDGKLVLAGYGVNGATSDFAVVRLNSSGTLDTSFSGDGKLFTAIGASEDLATSVTLQTDDKIVLAGTYANGANTDLAVARYNVDGSLDTSFDSDGIKTLALPAGSNQVTGVAVSNGRIVAVGTTQSKLAAVFLGTNGTPEATIGAVNTLDGAPTYTEGGAPAVLDANVQIFDAELSANNNFSGATLTLTRNGGANAQDVFSASGTLATLTQGGNLTVGGTTIGTVTTNSGGTLLLSFNGSATNALVNSAMQQIAYSNTSDAPAASVQINWTVNDGNSGTQGSGGALQNTGSTTVTITAVNDAPVLADTALSITVAEDAVVPSGAVGSLLSAFTGGISDVDSGALKGIAITASNETNGTWYYSTNSGTNWSTVGVVSNTSALLLADDGNTRLYFTPNADYNGTASSALTLRAWDRSSGSAGSKVDTSSNGGSTAYSSATDVVDVTVTAINDAPTFGVGAGGLTIPAGSVGGEAYSVIVQADGKIITAGYRNDAGQLDIQLIRCNADGSVDTGFGNNGRVITAIGAGADFAWEVALQADGKILVAGESYNGSNSDFALVRYNTDGSLDASFGSGGKVTTAIGSGNEQAMGLAVQADGRIVLAGWSGSDFALARYNTDGSLDASFGTGGKVVTSYGANSGAYSVAVQPDGKIVLAGSIWNGSNYDVAVLRYNTNGTLDAGFGSAGKVTTAVGTGHDFSYDLALQADGRIVLTGSTSNGGSGSVLVLRYNVDGSLDTSFNGTGKVSTAVGSYSAYGESVAIQPDGKIVVVGAARNASNTYDDSLVLRYNTDGSLDTSFNGSGKLTSELSSAGDHFYDLALQPDGTIVAAGYATINGTQEFLLARYTASDTLDPTFGTILGPLDGAPSYTEGGSAVVLDSDVRVYDAELTASNFSGATLTLARNGGANTQDVFSASGTLAALTQGGNLTVGGTTIGTVTTNSAGTLLLSFNASATNALLDSALQQIAYSNSSDTPPASVQIDWTFNDGNAGAQGTGGALADVGHTTVTITATNDAPTGSVTIDDTTPAQGQTLTASNTLADADGLGAISYQWQRAGIDIGGATGSTYTTTQADVGQILRVVASYTDGQGTLESVPSAGTSAVTNVNDAPTGSVTIDDTTPAQGQTLTASNTLADADGLGTIGYQWQRGGVDIVGATGTTYTTTQADVGQILRVVAIYTDGQGTLESVPSAGTSAVTNVNDAPSGSVTIDDTTPAQGQTLTASNTLADADGLGTIGYQWQRGGVDIVGATGSTYTTTQADVGQVLRVVASYTDGQGTLESVPSAGTSAVTNVNDAPTGSVTIDDTTPSQGQTLTASNTLADADGLGAISYQWQRAGVDIVGATASTYTTTQADVGQILRVVASYTDGQGTLESVPSAGISAVTNVNDAPTGSVTIGDTTPAQGQTLTASNTLADADGLGAISYQWQRAGVDIVGATGSTYTTTQADVGQILRVVASYTDGQGTLESVPSAGTSAVTNVNDAPSGSVTIDDTTPAQGQTLTASNTLADADGLGAISYQWQRGGVDIGGATGSTYTTTQADVGQILRLVASYTDGQGTLESVPSVGTSAVTNVNDAPTGSVTIDDTTPAQGQTLTASNTLADADGLGAIGYQWQRGGVDIGGATGSTYTTTQADVGQILRVVASYTDG